MSRGHAWPAVLALALGAAACHSPLRPATAIATPVPGSVDRLAAAIADDAERSDREPDSNVRATLAADATRDADACMARAPQTAACQYGRGVALGLEARAHPTHAGELLARMLESLSGAEGADPSYDEAGPARVRALVLIRAPGWPLGPGDPEQGVVAARRAVSLRPQHPPNLLALGEALSKTGDRAGAHRTYEQARTLAEAVPPSVNRDRWLTEADEGLRRTH